MQDNIFANYLIKPQRLVSFGNFLVTLGYWGAMFGFIGHFATTAMVAFDKLGGHSAKARMLADIYPSLPTWWVPESIIGAGTILILIVSGYWLKQIGEQVIRFTDL